MIYKEFIAGNYVNRIGSSITRDAVRGIIFEKNHFLMLYSEINQDYSFPGGGMEAGESEQVALKRELMEECGVQILSIDDAYAEIIEIDPANEPEIDLFIRHTKYFPCRISNTLCAPDLTPDELLRKSSPVWINLEVALYNNQTLLKSTNSPPPRWTKRETYILEQLIKHPPLYRGKNLD